MTDIQPTEIEGARRTLRQIMNEFDSFRPVIMCAPGCARKTVGTLMTEWAFEEFMEEPAGFVAFPLDGGMLHNRHGALCVVCPKVPSSRMPFVESPD